MSEHKSQTRTKRTKRPTISTSTQELQNTYEIQMDKERQIYLNYKLEKCKEDCEKINKEKKELDDFLTKKEIKGITLSSDKKLIDLLIECILNTSPEWKNNIDTLINIPTSLKGDGFLRGGDYFEALFQLAIAIGILPQFSNKFIRFYDIHHYKDLHPFDNYLYKKSIKNSGGGEQGISDITFEVSNNSMFEDKINTTYECGQPPENIVSKNSFYFISVKGYKKEKSVKNEYDIPLLDQQLKLFPNINKHIIVCVRNKERFLQNLSRTKIDFLKHSINYIIGYDELIEAFTQFRLNFFNKIGKSEKIKEEVHRLFPENTIYKPSLNLYFHQELIVKSVMTRIIDVHSPSKPHFLCIGVLPRGGKSFIAGGIINEHIKSKSVYNVLFLTSAVNETRDQFKKDLIEKFTDFRDFQFIDVVNQSNIDKTKPNSFYFVSRQLTSKREEEKEEKESTIETISKDMLSILEKKIGVIPNFDIIFFDEAHVGITSKTVRKNFQKAFEKFKIPIVLMTATYKKPAIFLDSNKTYLYGIYKI